MSIVELTLATVNEFEIQTACKEEHVALVLNHPVYWDLISGHLMVSNLPGRKLIDILLDQKIGAKLPSQCTLHRQYDGTNREVYLDLNTDNWFRGTKKDAATNRKKRSDNTSGYTNISQKKRRKWSQWDELASAEGMTPHDELTEGLSPLDSFDFNGIDDADLYATGEYQYYAHLTVDRTELTPKRRAALAEMHEEHGRPKGRSTGKTEKIVGPLRSNKAGALADLERIQIILGRKAAPLPSSAEDLNEPTPKSKWNREDFTWKPVSEVRFSCPGTIHMAYLANGYLHFAINPEDDDRFVIHSIPMREVQNHLKRLFVLTGRNWTEEDLLSKDKRHLFKGVRLTCNILWSSNQKRFYAANLQPRTEPH